MPLFYELILYYGNAYFYYLLVLFNIFSVYFYNYKKEEFTDSFIGVPAYWVMPSITIKLYSLKILTLIIQITI